MPKITAILALLVGAALATFVVENQGPLTLHFLWLTAHALPVSLALLAAAVLGLLVGLLLVLPGRLTAGRTVKRLRRDVAQEGRVAPLAPMSGPATTTTGDDAPTSRPRLRE
jgi:uncharacterized integral membrane protein